jgi:5'-3' exonuclease
LRTLLIDADTLIFEASSATEHEAQWEPWLWTLHGDFDAAMEHFDRSLSTLQKKLEADRMVLALSDDARWRNAVMPTYKAHRHKTRKPITYKPLREYCHEKYETFQRPMLEGDDVLGILATHPKIIPGEKIIVSIDKDMKTIPGWHLNYRLAADTGDYTPTRVWDGEADYWHLFQTLTGDVTDGYPGCPGIGPVKAEKLLEVGDRDAFDVGEVWRRVVVPAYEKANLSEAVALENARVARICRASDYSIKTKEVRLWTPPATAK